MVAEEQMEAEVLELEVEEVRAEPGGDEAGIEEPASVAAEDEDEVEDEDAWEEAYAVIGPFVLQAILRLRGLWVKTGQYISSRADVMPAGVVDPLQVSRRLCH